MRCRFHPDAEAELNEAVDYYEGCEDGLGMEFAKAVYAAIQNICQFPLGWTPLSPNTRRCLLSRFPYGLVYQVKNNEIIVIAVMLLNRKPDYWRKRRA